VYTSRNRKCNKRCDSKFTARKIKKPQLVTFPVVTSLKFARMNQNWEEHDWGRVLFSDESRFSSRAQDRVWRRQGERYSSGTVVQQNFWSGSVMGWPGISLEAKTGLFILQEKTLH
jgi:hypothetical protein